MSGSNEPRSPGSSRGSVTLKLSILLLTLLSSSTLLAQQGLNVDYYGEAQNIPLDEKKKAPMNGLGGDVFASELLIEGKTDGIALDTLSIEAQLYEQAKKGSAQRRERDASVRADISSGQPVPVLIAPEHFTQLSFLRDGEIVYPTRIYAAQPELVTIEKQDGSPYLYIQATTLLEGQPTNLFVETQEDGRIQTYVINLTVTTPENTREQVAINLINDLTPPIRGGIGSEEERRKNAASLLGLTPTTKAGGRSETKIFPGGVHRKFTREDVKRYLNTMIEMAERYPQAKQIEKETGKIIYRDTDISAYPGGKVTYVDPVDRTLWNVREVWFFPKYDAILLGVTCYNPTEVVSIWDYSQMRWRANQSNPIEATAASPVAMQTLPKNTNVIWYLIQGDRIDPLANFSPIFPKADRRIRPGDGAAGSTATTIANTK